MEQAGQAVHLTRRDSLRLLSLAGLSASSVSAQASHPAPDVAQELRIGAEYFLNPSETSENVQRNFRLMRESGLTLVRIFVIWNDVERRPGVWDFSRYDWIYDAAAANEIKIVTTLCSEDPVGWRNDGPFYHNRTNLDDPRIRENAAEYIRRVVTRYRSHPAQGVWLLMNEPTKYNADHTTFLAFGNWLRQKYGSLEALNRRWFRQFNSFSEVTITPEMLTGGNYGWLDYPPIVDWREFNIDNLVRVLLWIKSQVLLYDKNHPTHINVTDPLGGPNGQDVWKEGKTVDILGASVHPAWMFPPSAAKSAYGEIFAYHLDLIGGPSGSKPWWVTELQGGPTIFTGKFPFNPAPADLRRWLWDAFGAGARGVIFWLWNPREAGQEGGEWSLVSPNGKPSIRLAAVKQVAEDLKAFPLLATAPPQEPRVAILYSRETAILNNLEGNRSQRRGDEWRQSLEGCYYALRRAHIPAQFIDLEQLKQGEAQRFDVLYAPYCYAIDDQGVAALRKYVEEGGTLWADGLTAWKDDMGRIRPSIPGNLSEVFGFEASDVYPVKVDEPYSVTPVSEMAGELWRLQIETKGAKPFLRDADGKPFALRHQFGRGRVIYFESALALAYAKRTNAIVQRWIVDPARSHAAGLDVQLVAGSPRISFRGLIHSEGFVAVLSNWGPEERLTLVFRGHCAVKNALTGQDIPGAFAEGRTVVNIVIRAEAVLVLNAVKH